MRVTARDLIESVIEAKEPDSAKLAKWAAATEKVAARYKKDADGDPDDLADAKEIMKVAKAIRSGNQKLARKLADNLDSAPREDLPSVTWKWLDLD